MRRLSVILALLALTLGTGSVRASVDVPEPQPMTVYVYEDANGWNGGDVLRTGPALWQDVHRGNLAAYTTGLHSGCNAFPFASSTWDNCISSVYIPGMEPGLRLVLYLGAGYTGETFTICSQGYYNLSSYWNDTVSSFRILSGGC
jgi:hypothetical protein